MKVYIAYNRPYTIFIEKATSIQSAMVDIEKMVQSFDRWGQDYDPNSVAMLYRRDPRVWSVAHDNGTCGEQHQHDDDCVVGISGTCGEQHWHGGCVIGTDGYPDYEVFIGPRGAIRYREVH